MNQIPPPKSNLILRRRDKQTRFYIDNEFIEKGYAALFGKAALVYFVLARHAHNKTQEAYPGYKRIMQKSGIKNKNMIAKIISTLESLNMIIVIRSKGRNLNKYYLVDSSRWIELDTDIHSSIRTVLKSYAKRYQKKQSNGIGLDTPSQLSSSPQEVLGKDIVKHNNNDALKELPPEEVGKDHLKYLDNIKRPLLKKLSWRKY